MEEILMDLLLEGHTTYCVNRDIGSNDIVILVGYDYDMYSMQNVRDHISGVMRVRGYSEEMDPDIVHRYTNGDSLIDSQCLRSDCLLFKFTFYGEGEVDDTYEDNI